MRGEASYRRGARRRSSGVVVEKMRAAAHQESHTHKCTPITTNGSFGELGKTRYGS
jgi:hypothetical protein